MPEQVYVTMRSSRGCYCDPKIGRVYSTLESALTYFEIPLDEYVHVTQDPVPTHGMRRGFGTLREGWVYSDDEYDYYIAMRKVDS